MSRHHCEIGTLAKSAVCASVRRVLDKLMTHLLVVLLLSLSPVFVVVIIVIAYIVVAFVYISIVNSDVVAPF